VQPLLQKTHQNCYFTHVQGAGLNHAIFSWDERPAVV
jgi:hypothetical protein